MKKEVKLVEEKIIKYLNYLAVLRERNVKKLEALQCVHHVLHLSIVILEKRKKGERKIEKLNEMDNLMYIIKISTLIIYANYYRSGCYDTIRKK